MASDEGDEKHEASAPGEAPHAPKAHEPVTPSEARAELARPPAALAAGTAGLSEWTASDARGPLAEPIDLVESSPAEVVPPHPYDATGFDREPAPLPPPVEAGAEAPPLDTPPPEAEAPPGTGVQPPAPRRRSIRPVAAAIVIGALIGAGTNQLARMQWSGGSALRRDVAALKVRVDQLSKAVPAAEATPSLAAGAPGSPAAGAAPSPAAGAQESPAAGASGIPAPDISAIKDTLAALSAKAAAAEASLQKLQAASGAANNDVVKDLNGKVAALQAALAAVQNAQGESAAGLKANGAKVAALDSGLDTLRTGQKSLEGKVNAPALAVLTQSLIERIEHGQPFAAETSALETADADPAKLAILRPHAAQGVLTAKALAAKFETLSDGLNAAAHKLPPGASYWDRLKEGASSLVSIHKAGDTSASDPSSRLAEIQDALQRGDVTAAASLWSQLPADVKTKPEAAGFAAALNAHAEASLAAKAINEAAIAALGVKKS